MANKFVSVLDHIGTGLKDFFENPVTEEVAQGGISVAELAFPEFDTLLGGLSKSLAVAQALAQAANVSGDTTAQVTALALADGQTIFNTYQQATGVTLETAQQQAIVAGLLNILKLLPAPTSAAAAPAPARCSGSCCCCSLAASAPAPAPAAPSSPLRRLWRVRAYKAYSRRKLNRSAPHSSRVGRAFL